MTTSPSETKAVVDAGTGQVVTPESSDVGVTDERKAEIKAKAAKLTHIPDGNKKLSALLEKYKAPSFGKVADGDLLALEADIDGELALA